MKMRKGWVVTWSDGTRWFGDCDNWAGLSRKAGHNVERTMIMGTKRWGGCCGQH